MIIYQYVLKVDHGFAPNPFYGVCTLACCKPRMRNAITRKLTENFIRYIKNKEKITGNLTSKKKAELGLPSNITIEVIKEY